MQRRRQQADRDDRDQLDLEEMVSRGRVASRLPATALVDNGLPNRENTRAHATDDSRDCEDDERGFPARDPVPELGARPLGRAPEKPLP